MAGTLSDLLQGGGVGMRVGVVGDGGGEKAERFHIQLETRSQSQQGIQFFSVHLFASIRQRKRDDARRR